MYTFVSVLKYVNLAMDALASDVTRGSSNVIHIRFHTLHQLSLFIFPFCSSTSMALLPFAAPHISISLLVPELEQAPRVHNLTFDRHVR